MPFHDERGLQVPAINSLTIQPGSIDTAGARQAAWAFAIGGTPASEAPARASRRGDLPDVDFSQVARVPRRSIWSRLSRVFRAASSGVTSSQAGENSGNIIPFRRAA